MNMSGRRYNIAINPIENSSLWLGDKAMNANNIMIKIESLLADSKAAVLATVDESGNPRMRWMTPTIISGRDRAIYAVTTPETRKVLDLGKHPEAEYMIQNLALTEIINIKGIMRLIDNPALKAEVMEQLGPRLTVFWKTKAENTDFVVLETRILEATYFQPMKGRKERVSFEEN